MIFRVLSAELRKTKGTYGRWLPVVSPFLVSGLYVIGAAMSDGGASWVSVLTGANELWSSIVLPMLIMSMSVVMAQAEHKSGTWSYVLSAPVGYWDIFSAKVGLIGLAVLCGGILLFCSLPVGLALVDFFRPVSLMTGNLDLSEFFVKVSAASAAALPLIFLMFWVAHRFHSYVPVLLLGIVGTVIGVVLRGHPLAGWLPWLMPFRAQLLGDDGLTVLWGSSLGGILIGTVLIGNLVKWPPTDGPA